MAITIQEERITEELKDEFTSLAYKHWEEIATHKDIPMSIDWESYEALDNSDHLVGMTARDGDGILVGYAVFILHYHPHYKEHIYAQQDVLFVDMSKRKTMAGVGLKLIRESEKVLASYGVDVIHHHVKVKHDFSPFLERLDYNFVEKIYEKRIS